MAIPNRNINYPTAIKYGAGRIKELAEFCKANGIKRPLVVTDKGLAAMPMVAEKRAVNPPTHATVASASGCKVNSGYVRAIKYTPAVTMVAA